jgi:uncharacterized repeat protein (TIGR01451 family)
MLEARVSPNGRYGSLRSRCRQAGVVSAAVLLLSLDVLTTGAQATPGHPGEPQPPKVVYTEDFENGVQRTPVLLTNYRGAPPLEETYTADKRFLENCDGNIVEFESNERKQATDCEEVAFNRVRQMAWVLGKLRNAANPKTNHAVSAYTDGGKVLPANSLQFETIKPIPLVTSSRFITFSVDAAETNCKHSHAELKFYLLNGASEIPTFTSPIDPCTDKNAKTIEPPELGTKPAEPFKAGTFAGNAATLFSGSALGIRMRNGQTSEDGNDASFDSIEVLDATPQLDKSFSPTVLAVGETSELTYTITNTSELAAKNGWSFSDALPAGLVVASPARASTTCTAPTTVTATGGGSSIAVTGNLAAEVNYCTVTVDVTSGKEGNYVNGPDDITKHAGIELPEEAPVTFSANADMQIEKSASPSPATPGTDETYTLQVKNNGPDTAENVVVSDRLPAGLSFVSGSPGCEPVELSRKLPPPPAGHRRRTTARGPGVSCALGDMAPGAHVTLTIVAHVASSVTEGFLNTAAVSSTTPDPEPANNEAAVDTPVPPEADLAIEKTASPSTVTAGGQVTYTLAVKNNGPNDATGVIVLDHPPPGLSILSAEPSQGTCVHASVVLCSLGQVLNGASAQILVTANIAPSASGALTNTATATGGQTDPNPANNTSSATIDVTPLTPARLPASEVLASITTAPAQGFSDLSIVKHVNHTTAHQGQHLTYTLTVTNNGLDDDPGVNVTDTWSLPLNTLSAHSTQGACNTGQPLTCALGTIKRGASATITIIAKAKQAGQERNTARVTGANRDPDLSNNQSSADTNILHRHRRPTPPPPVTG